MNLISPYWQGILPALILTCNPAINYAIFDTIKPILLKSNNKKNSNKAMTNILFNTTLRIFLTGLIAKAIATLVTYPLIRIKVIMMAMGNSRKGTLKKIDGISLSKRIQIIDEALKTGEGKNEDAINSSPSSAGSEFFDPRPTDIDENIDDEKGDDKRQSETNMKFRENRFQKCV